MTEPPRASVIVVSHDRADALARCVRGIAQLDYAHFELVIVADAPGRAVLAQLGLGKAAKILPFERANISQARNIAIEHAAGDILAFIDDDSVPEPSWLSRLVAVFADDRVAAASGFVRGRNGISFQHRASWIDSRGRRHALEVDPDSVTLHQGQPGAAVKTEGTNMAFRRALLTQMGGFDPGFRFYMDETDLNMRQALEEQITAVVPLAQVHHGFAASQRRRGDRVPLDLFEIGASTALFLRKHADAANAFGQIELLRKSQQRRLLRLMVSGGLEPRDVTRLMKGLEDGLADGSLRAIESLPSIGAPQEEFRPFPGAGPRPGRVLAGWFWQSRRLHETALAFREAGAVVTVYRFSPTTLYHRMSFQPEGYWLQQGGCWGRSERNQPLIRARRLTFRLQEEIVRIARLRPVDSLIG